MESKLLVERKKTPACFVIAHSEGIWQIKRKGYIWFEFESKKEALRKLSKLNRGSIA